MEHRSNPFEHRHQAHADGVGAEPLDPAQESLADALKVSFFLLKVVMFGLLAWYLFASGLFNVSEQQVAVRLRFGNLVGDGPARQVIGPGGPYFTLPYPIDEVIKVDTKLRTLELEDSFWFEITERDLGKSLEELAAGKRGPLNPERDSYVLTGDANVIHVRWTVSYKIGGGQRDAAFAERVVEYVSNVGDESAAERLLRAAADRGIVVFAGSTTADELVNGISEAETSTLRRLIQEGLDAVGSGLEVTGISMTMMAVPPPVREAFDAVSAAEAEKGRLIEAARKQRNAVLNDVAGAAHEGLWRMVQDYQIAYEAGNVADRDALHADLAAAFEKRRLPQRLGGGKIGGAAAQVVSDARSYRTLTRKQAAAEAELFVSLHKKYKESPEIVMTRLWETARENIMAGRSQKLITRGARIVIQMNPDPRLKSRWEQEDLEKKDEDGAAGR